MRNINRCAEIVFSANHCRENRGRRSNPDIIFVFAVFYNELWHEFLWRWFAKTSSAAQQQIFLIHIDSFQEAQTFWEHCPLQESQLPSFNMFTSKIVFSFLNRIKKTFKLGIFVLKV